MDTMFGTPAPQVRPKTQGTGFINLESYLNADQGSSQALGQNIRGGYLDKGKGIQDDATKGADDFIEGVKAKTFKGLDPNDLSDSNVTAMKGAYGSQGIDPKSIQNDWKGVAGEFQNRVSGVSEEAKTLEGEFGRNAALQGQFGASGRYGQGNKSLDSFILGHQNVVPLIQQDLGATGGAIDALGTGVGSRVGEVDKDEQKRLTDFMGQVSGQYSSEYNPLATQASQAIVDEQVRLSKEGFTDNEINQIINRGFSAVDVADPTKLARLNTLRNIMGTGELRGTGAVSNAELAQKIKDDKERERLRIIAEQKVRDEAEKKRQADIAAAKKKQEDDAQNAAAMAAAGKDIQGGFDAAGNPIKLLSNAATAGYNTLENNVKNVVKEIPVVKNLSSYMTNKVATVNPAKKLKVPKKLKF